MVPSVTWMSPASRASRFLLVAGLGLTLAAGALAGPAPAGTPGSAVAEKPRQKAERVVFILWGVSARKKRTLVDTTRHVIIESAHPSPLSAHNGFLGSRPFSRANAALVDAGRDPVDWRIPPR